MPPTDTRTANRNYPKADIANNLNDDMSRVGGDGMDAVDADVQTLADELAGKAAAGHGHAIGDITELPNQLAALALAIADNAGTLEGLTDTDTTGVTQGMILQFFAGGWKAVVGKANNFGLDPITGLTSNNVQEAIEELVTQVTTPSVEPAFQTYVTDGLTGRFTLPVTPNSKNVVFLNLNGVTVLHEDYALEGADVVFNEIRPAGLTLNAIVLTAVEIATPSAGAVGFPQLSTDTSQLALMLGALEQSSRRFRWNYLINPFFRYNERGQASYTGAGICLDGWKYADGAGATCTYSQIERPADKETEFALRWQRTAAGTGVSFLTQRMAGVRNLAGKKITAFFRCEVEQDTELNVRLWQQFGTGSNSPSPSNPFYSMPVSLTAGENTIVLVIDVPDLVGKTVGNSPSNNNSLEIGFEWPHDAPNPVNAIEFNTAAVVEGDASSDDNPAHDRGALEQWLCWQFYYRWFQSSSSDYLRAFSLAGTGGNANFRGVNFPFPVPMIRSPDVTAQSTLGALSVSWVSERAVYLQVDAGNTTSSVAVYEIELDAGI